MIRLADFDSPGLRRPAVSPRPVARYEGDAEWGGPAGLGPEATARADALRHGWGIVGADQAEHRLVQWQFEEDARLDAAAAELAPGEAEGFAERIAGDYFSRAKGFRETLPQASRTGLDEQLARHEQRLFARASEIESREQLRSARAGLDASLQATLLPAVAAAAKRAPGDPEKSARLAGIEAEAARLIDRNPVLRPDEKEAHKANALGMIHSTFAEALPEAEKLDLDPDGSIETIGERIRRLAGETAAQEGEAPSDAASDIDADGFGRAAWLGLIRRHRPDLASGRSIADILALRADSELSAELRERGLTDAGLFLVRSGHAATPGTLYLAHTISPEGGAALLDADPGQSAAAIDPEAAKDRPDFFYDDGDPARPRTVGAVIAAAEAAMEGARPVDWRRRLAGVSPEMLQALSKDAGVVAARQATEAKLADDTAYRTQIEAAERAIDDGGFGLADLQKAAGDGGWLRGGGDFERLYGRIASRAAETLAHEKAVSKYTDQDYRFDPASADDRAAVDLIYERGIAGSEGESAEGDEAAQRLLRQIVARTGIVPAGATDSAALADTGLAGRGSDTEALDAYERYRRESFSRDPDDPEQDPFAYAVGEYLFNKSIPAGMVKSLYGALTLPGDVFAGRVDPRSQEAIERAADLAGLLALGGTGAPQGALASGMARPPRRKSPGGGGARRGDRKGQQDVETSTGRESQDARGKEQFEDSGSDREILNDQIPDGWKKYKVAEIDRVEGRSSDAIRGTPEHGALNNPEPLTIYRLDDRDLFVTNEFGYTEQIVYKPISNKRGRNTRNQAKVRSEGHSPTDVGGHYRSVAFGGSSDRFNLFPQNANFNSRAYKKWELKIRKHIDNVDLINTMVYRKNPAISRPDRLDIEYWINGRKYFVKFKNESGG